MSGTPPIQRRYSEDGSHWWDGRAWQPVQPARPAQPGPPPPPAHASQTGSPAQRQTPAAYNTAQAPEPGPRVPLVVILLMIGFVALVAGSVGGSFVAERIASTSVGDPPQIPEGFPDGQQRYFAGVTVSQVTEDWLGNTQSAWTCREEAPLALDDAEHRVLCHPADENVSHLADVAVWHDGEDKVTELSAHCHRGLAAGDCRRHFQHLCDVVFSGDPSTAKEAKKWVRRNMDNDRPAVFGDVHISMPLENASAVIHAKPVG